MKKLFVVRHGETRDAADYRYGGDADLNPRGYDQAVKLGERLIGEDISMIFHSPKRRADQTAHIIAAVYRRVMTNAPLFIEPLEELAERFYGDYEGKTRDEVGHIEERLSLKRDYSFLENSEVTPPGGEPNELLTRRVTSILPLVRSIDGNVVAVTHNNPAKIIYSHFKPDVKPVDLRKKQFLNPGEGFEFDFTLDVHNPIIRRLP